MELSAAAISGSSDDLVNRLLLDFLKNDPDLDALRRASAGVIMSSRQMADRDRIRAASGKAANWWRGG